MFLLSYVPVFPSFLKLREKDPDIERPFKVSGGKGFLKFMAIVPMVFIIISLIFTAIPLSFDADTLAEMLPITIGSIVFILIGEIIIKVKHVKND